MSSSLEKDLLSAENYLKELKSLLSPNASADQITKASTLLKKLKLSLTHFQLIPPFTLDLALTRKQLSIAREAYEQGCYYSILSKDVKGFERHLHSVKVYYNDYSSLLPESSNRYPLLGLWLLYLLAHNHIDDFHSELELITSQNTPSAKSSANTAMSTSSTGKGADSLEELKLERKESLTDTLYSSIYIRYPVMLEQHLMEGSYNKILHARSSMPSPYFTFFLDILSETVRVKIAECSEKAFEDYPLKEAKKLLMLKTDQEVDDFAKTRGWTISGDKIRFSSKKNGLAHQLNAHTVIKQMMDYANELERII